jgi:thiol-disulfide isomerase/thioredoxin
MPIVNGLEQEYRGELSVIYVSMDEAEGREIARDYGVIGTPTILLLDGEGNQVQVLRGSIPALLVEGAVEDLVRQQGGE